MGVMTKTQTPEARFAARVGDALRDEQRSVAWLARQTGIAASTLRYQLDRPATLSLRHACAVRDALGVDL